MKRGVVPCRDCSSFLWIIRVAVAVCAGSLDYLSETLYFGGRNVGFTGGCSLKTIASIAHPGPLSLCSFAFLMQGAVSVAWIGGASTFRLHTGKGMLVDSVSKGGGAVLPCFPGIKDHNALTLLRGLIRLAIVRFPRGGSLDRFKHWFKQTPGFALITARNKAQKKVAMWMTTL